MVKICFKIYNCPIIRYGGISSMGGHRKYTMGIQSQKKKNPMQTEGSKFVQYTSTYSTKVDKLFHINRKVHEFSNKIILKQRSYIIASSRLYSASQHRLRIQVLVGLLAPGSDVP
jgi:hypothetical protein